MASAQVLSNSSVSSRKKDLEAGKRRLEEFRKKKAAAKKTLSTSQSGGGVSTANEKQASENGQAQFVNPVGAAADGRTDSVTQTTDDEPGGLVHDSGSESLSIAHVKPQSHNFTSFDVVQTQRKQDGASNDIPRLTSQTGFSYQKQTDNRAGNFGTDTAERKYADGSSFAGSNAPHDHNSRYFHSTEFGNNESLSIKDGFSESVPDRNASISDIAAKVNPEGHATHLLHGESDSLHPTTVANASSLDYSQPAAPEFKNHFRSGLEEIKPNSEVGTFSSFFSQKASESFSDGFNSDVSGSFSGPSFSVGSETHSRRSRPSFLDALNISRESVASVQAGSEKENLITSKFPSSNLNPSTASAPVEPLPTPMSPNPSADYFGNAFRGQNLFANSLQTKLESDLQKQNEDFAALEQHIEDLTQEKFSLQRAMEASKALAESLAAENSSLTESYNQQASIVNQLKVEMERLQAEIKARLVELESFKAEYMNAQLECNAADERAKLLASEVIGLEEKALRLRSNELKLERELENASSEMASYKKKVSSLEKERSDLVQTIDALQEEKKLLQSKFRKASANLVSIDISKGHAKKDTSTSTNDIGFDDAAAGRDISGQVSSNMQVHDDTDNLLSLAQNISAGFEDSSMSIPPDQMQMIQNINSLICEIMAEKEEMMQALVSEVTTSTKLKDLNKELSQKLEVQTQRLELLTAQSMANDNIPARQPSGSVIVRESVAYADEGDEVVERVLGWIMKLFPGGPSKRRTSRL